MEVRIEKLEGCKRSLNIELPSERADGVYRQLLQDFKKNLQVPGFRRGKVPESLIKRRFASELRGEVISKLVPQALEEAIKEKGLRPVERPTLEDVDYKEGQPLRINASFEVRPELQLGKVTGLEIDIDGSSFQVSEQQIDEQLEMLRQRSATFKPIDEDRAAHDGDFAVVNLRGELRTEDAAPFRREGVIVAVSSDQIFSRHLIGARPGQRLEFSVKHPEDFEDPALAGKTADYTVDLLELKQRILPELDDEFAKDLGQFSDLDELRAEIRLQLEADAQRLKRSDIVKKLVDKIIESNPSYEIPSVLLQRQLAAAESEMRRSMIERGVNPDHIGFDWSAFREAQRPTAELAVRRMLLFDEVAEREGINVKPKDVKAEIEAIAASRGQDPSKLRQEMLSDGSYEALERHLRNRAVTDWLIENNSVVEG